MTDIQALLERLEVHAFECCGDDDDEHVCTEAATVIRTLLVREAAMREALEAVKAAEIEALPERFINLAVLRRAWPKVCAALEASPPLQNPGATA